VELWVLGTDDTDTHLSRVEDLGGQTVTLAMPMRKLNLVPVPVGQHLSLRVVRPDGLRSLTTRVESVTLQPRAVLQASAISEWRREQRRASARLQVSIVPDYIDLLMPDRRRPLHVRVVNLSAGGALLVSRRQPVFERSEIGPRADLQLIRHHRNDTFLEVKLSLDRLALVTRASVVRIEEVVEDDDFYYTMGVRFLDMDRHAEQAIFRFVFEEQRRMLRDSR
jgi:c-di-GMP-binding flagellar brake protein YcgR